MTPWAFMENQLCGSMAFASQVVDRLREWNLGSLLALVKATKQAVAPLFSSTCQLVIGH